MVKELVTENVEGGHIVFCEEASNLVTHPEKAGKSSVPLLSVKIGEHCYYGLCDIGASTSAISHALYMEIRKEIEPCELEYIDVVIQLANRETICPIGIVRDVEVLCGRTKYPADFLVLATTVSDACPIIFGRPFLNTCGAVVDCQKEKVFTNFNGESYEFNFSKFAKNYYEPELPNENFQVEQLASIAVLLTMLCSNSWRIMKVMFLKKKERRLMTSFYVNLRCFHMIYLWRTWEFRPLLRKTLFLILSLYLMILSMFTLMIRKYILLLLVLNFQGKKKQNCYIF